jgi:hypothetical protein
VGRSKLLNDKLLVHHVTSMLYVNITHYLPQFLHSSSQRRIQLYVNTIQYCSRNLQTNVHLYSEGSRFYKLRNSTIRASLMCRTSTSINSKYMTPVKCNLGIFHQFLLCKTTLQNIRLKSEGNLTFRHRN